MLGTRSARLAISLTLALATGGSVATAQSADGRGSGAVQTTGTSTLAGEVMPGDQSFVDGVLSVRDNVLVTVEDTSDPRTSGRATITVNSDTYLPTDATASPMQIRYGQMLIENDEGTWAGTFMGRLSHGAFTQTYWLRGEGAYEGLSYVVTAGGMGPVWESQGVIYPGELPPTGSSAPPQLERLGPGGAAASQVSLDG